MEAHWTEKSTKDYQFRIAADFISQVEEKMESEKITQDALAKLTRLTKGRISQVLRNPGNMTIGIMVKFARAVGLKISLVAYDDNDPGNERGPINSDIFRMCWEKSGKPHDFWSVQQVSGNVKIAANISETILSVHAQDWRIQGVAGGKATTGTEEFKIYSNSIYNN